MKCDALPRFGPQESCHGSFVVHDPSKLIPLANALDARADWSQSVSGVQLRNYLLAQLEQDEQAEWYQLRAAADVSEVVTREECAQRAA